MDDFSNSYPESLVRVEKLAGNQPVVVEGDLTDQSNLHEIFHDHSDISAVVHFAAFKAVGESSQFPLKYYHNNVAGSISLLRAMELAGVNYLVFSSSCTVYGEPTQVPIDESHPVGEFQVPMAGQSFKWRK